MFAPAVRAVSPLNERAGAPEFHASIPVCVDRLPRERLLPDIADVGLCLAPAAGPHLALRLLTRQAQDRRAPPAPAMTVTSDASDAERLRLSEQPLDPAPWCLGPRPRHKNAPRHAGWQAAAQSHPGRFARSCRGGVTCRWKGGGPPRYFSALCARVVRARRPLFSDYSAGVAPAARLASWPARAKGHTVSAIAYDAGFNNLSVLPRLRRFTQPPRCAVACPGRTGINGMAKPAL